MSEKNNKIFIKRLGTTDTYDPPTDVSDNILEKILTNIDIIKTHQIEADKILQTQWFMHNIEIPPKEGSKGSKDPKRELHIFNSTQELLDIAIKQFNIKNDPRMIDFFKVLFPP
jgi:hypothetical protein